MADKYGIPEGGNNNYPGVIKFYGGAKANYQLTWDETIAAIARGGWPEKLWAEAAATVAAESDRKPLIYNTYKLGHFGLLQISREAHPDLFAPGGNGLNWIAPWQNAAEGYKIYQSQGWKAWQGHGGPAYLTALPSATAAVAAYKAKVGALKGEAAWLKVSRQKTNELIIGVYLADPQGAQEFSDAVGKSLAGAVGAGAKGTAEGVTASGGAVADAVKSIAPLDFLNSAWEALTTPAFWMRIAYGATGIVLVAGGLMLIVRNAPAVQKTASTVTKAATKGAVG